ncbi:hypothetical protein N0V93_004882 [Gnomoniopsis smithogilvyi]|uniref:Glyoxalase-like domain-containing protein n=1 Tax=Gnomoniopsis smithogilvyi TaxID=1191159 RepID=A0A9W9CXH7_9PEZI|nr:hypothetical protein N0V93_004882 [Gnomoniopsis smithogilvyi]
MASVASPILDHIVVLVTHDILLNLPSWLDEAFTVLNGGRHADGVTENKLILFQDGVYIELIAFVPGKDDERKSHRWGQRRQGHIIDWANTLHDEDDLAAIRSRVASADTGLKYDEPQSGGRVRPDGKELKWVTSAPTISDDSSKLNEFVGGEAPFWCLDRTPRDLRVPYQVEGNVQHPCGALGVAGVTVAIRDAQLFQKLKSFYDALRGEEGKELQQRPHGSVNAYVWKLGVPEAPNGQNGKRTLTLAQIDPEMTEKKHLDVYVELDLVGSSEGSVSGHLGDKQWPLKFNLKG